MQSVITMSKEIDSITDILNDLDNHMTYLEDNIVSLTSAKAKDMLLNQIESSKVFKTLIELQRLHSIVLRYHPEEIYSRTKERIKGSEETIYNLLIELSERNSLLIDYSIRIFQHYLSRAQSLRYGITSRICFQWLTGSLDKHMSFQTAILNILSNYNKIYPYFKYLKISEREKGEVEAQKEKGFEKEFPSTQLLPQPLTKKSDEGKK